MRIIPPARPPPTTLALWRPAIRSSSLSLAASRAILVLHCPFFPSCIIHLTRLVALSTTKHQGNFLFFLLPDIFSLILSFLGVLCSLQSSKHWVYHISTLFCFPIRPLSLLSAPLGSLSHRDGESQQSRVNTPKKFKVLDRRLGVSSAKAPQPRPASCRDRCNRPIVGFSCSIFQEWRPSLNRTL